LTRTSCVRDSSVCGTVLNNIQIRLGKALDRCRVNQVVEDQYALLSMSEVSHENLQATGPNGKTCRPPLFLRCQGGCKRVLCTCFTYPGHVTEHEHIMPVQNICRSLVAYMNERIALGWSTTRIEKELGQDRWMDDLAFAMAGQIRLMCSRCANKGDRGALADLIRRYDNSLVLTGTQPAAVHPHGKLPFPAWVSILARDWDVDLFDHSAGLVAKAKVKEAQVKALAQAHAQVQAKAQAQAQAQVQALFQAQVHAQAQAQLVAQAQAQLEAQAKAKAKAQVKAEALAEAQAQVRRAQAQADNEVQAQATELALVEAITDRMSAVPGDKKAPTPSRVCRVLEQPTAKQAQAQAEDQARQVQACEIALLLSDRIPAVSSDKKAELPNRVPPLFDGPIIQEAKRHRKGNPKYNQ